MKGIIFAMKSLLLMVFASFFGWSVTYLGLTYALDLDLIWSWRSVLILSIIMGWVTSWIPFVAVLWLGEKE